MLASLPAGKRGRKADRLAIPRLGTQGGSMYTPASLPGPQEIRLPPAHGPVHHDPAHAVRDGITHSIGRWLPEVAVQSRGGSMASGPGSGDDPRTPAARQPDGAGRHGSGIPGDPPPSHPGRPGMPRRGSPGRSGPGVQRPVRSARSRCRHLLGSPGPDPARCVQVGRVAPDVRGRRQAHRRR